MVDEKELIISPFPRIDLMQEMLRLREDWKRLGKSPAELASIDTFVHAHTRTHASSPDCMFCICNVAVGLCVISCVVLCGVQLLDALSGADYANACFSVVAIAFWRGIYSKIKTSWTLRVYSLRTSGSFFFFFFDPCFDLHHVFVIN
jgi:hypothetical protein